MIHYIEKEAAFLEYSKYYDGSLQEFIKSRFELVKNYDDIYFMPFDLINNNDDKIILAT